MNGPVQRTRGQLQAIDELRAIERVTEGGVTLAVPPDLAEEHGWLALEVTVRCTPAPDTTPIAKVEDREKVQVVVPPSYPLQRPAALVTHRRFAHLPHVVWGTTICLYLSAADWDPGRGMDGFIGRLLDWFTHLTDGTLTGADLPWDPPITHTARSPGFLIVEIDLPESLEVAESGWAGFAVVERTGPERYEVKRWIANGHADDGTDRGGHPFVAPLALLPVPATFSYPECLGDLLVGLTQQGIPALEQLMNAVLSQSSGDRAEADGFLPLVLIGSPAPRHAGARSRVAHLAAWVVDTDNHHQIDPQDRIIWMHVYDQRPRVTTRRDVGRPTHWLAGKRVLLLGCGALGAPVAEHCARAGASALHLVDDSAVRPGVLVRQPYGVDDIGYAKAQVLGRRLGASAANVEVQHTVLDAVELISGTLGLPDVDLIIDATASLAVAAALEGARWTGSEPRPPLLSLMVGHRCELAAATLALPASSGAGADILRRLVITAIDDESLHDLLDDFHPDLPRTEVFQPEPGCSDATYIGSAADLASFAAQLLNDALAVLNAPAHDAAPARWATVLRAPAARGPATAPQRLHWPKDLVMRDRDHNYEIRIEPHAFAEMRHSAVLMASERGPEVETGGLLLGQVDHASRVVWVSDARGLPPGSEASPEGLVLAPEDIEADADERYRDSRGLIAFIGTWHTHPRWPARPSVIDQHAMDQMVTAGHTPMLLLILGDNGGGHWQRWLDGRDRPDRFARLYFP